VMRCFFQTATVLALFFLTACVGTVQRNQTVPVVAVWNLEDSSLEGNGFSDLGEILAFRIIETLQTSGYEVVEREKLLLALEELKLGSSKLASEKAQLRIGHLSGARWMIFGGYQVIAGQMRMDLRLVDVETGRVLNAAEKTIPTHNGIGFILKSAGEVTNTLLPPKRRK